MKKVILLIGLSFLLINYSSCIENKHDYDYYKVIFDGNGGRLISGKEVQYIKSIEEDVIFPLYEKDMCEFQEFIKEVNEVEKTINYKAVYKNLTIKKMTPFEMVNDITFGYNHLIGSFGDEDTVHSKIFDMVKDYNINAISLPCSFYDHMNEGYLIDESYLNEIKQMVDEVVKRDMYCMICFYDSPDVRWGNLDYDNYDKFMKMIDVQVKQVSEYFIEYNELVTFSFLGESKDYQDYKFDKEAAHILNDANQRFVNTVRSTKGNNTYRMLVISTGLSEYSHNGYKYFKKPNDDYLIIRLHVYEPFELVHEPSFEFSSWAGKEVEYKLQLLSIMKTIQTNFIDKGMAVIIGEFASRDKGNTIERCKWLEFYVSLAYCYNIKCYIWEACKVHMEKDFSFALINKYDYTWLYEEYTNKLKELVKDKKYIPFYKETFNLSQSIKDEIIIPNKITNLITNELENVVINYDRSLIKEVDGKFYPTKTGLIIFDYYLNNYHYYYSVLVVNDYETMQSDFEIEIKPNDQNVLQCYITSFGFSKMRVDYDWYSSDESLLTINKYSSITLHKDGTCAIIAINKETEQIGVVEVVIEDLKIKSFKSLTNLGE